MKTVTEKMLKTIEIKMVVARKNVVKAIASEIKNFNRRAPVERMAATIDLGRKFNEVFWNPNYGLSVWKEIVSIVEPLWDDERAFEILNFGMMDKASEKFILEQTAIPMDNGQHLALGHWIWLRNRLFGEGSKKQHKELLDELDWLRKASPSEEVIEHVEGVFQQWYQKEMEMEHDQRYGGEGNQSFKTVVVGYAPSIPDRTV